MIHQTEKPPVAEEGRDQCAYSIQLKWVFQKVISMADSRSLLALSVCPSVCGWKRGDRLTVASRAWQNDLQTCEMNWRPRSETMSNKYAWRWKTWFIKKTVVLQAEGSLGRPMKWADLENRSIKVLWSSHQKEGARWQSPRRCETNDDQPSVRGSTGRCGQNVIRSTRGLL